MNKHTIPGHRLTTIGQRPTDDDQLNAAFDPDPIDISHRLACQDWTSVNKTLHNQGFVLLKNILTEKETDHLIAAYDDPNAYRKTIVMERYRFGKGAYKYFKYPLPPLINTLREQIYPYIAPVGNAWMKELGINTCFPPTLAGMQKICHEHGQTHPTVLILKYAPGGFNTLHQDLYGDVYFPLQAVLMLDEPGTDYTGGEFVITEQVPRAQSKVNVLQPRRGDMLLFTTHFRPAAGKNGYYKVHMKHGVSPLHSGTRHSLGIIFHDAAS